MKIRLFCDAPERWRPEIEHALAVLMEGVGCPAEWVPSPTTAHVAYAAARPCGFPDQGIWIVADAVSDWNGGEFRVGELAGLPCFYQGRGPRGASSAGPMIDGDIVYSTYLLISGAAESDAPRDAWGSLVAEGWRLKRAGVLESPCVASYCARLRELMRHSFPDACRPVPLWPEGKEYAVVLSHDVDCPYGSTPPRLAARQLVEAVRRGQVAGSLWSVARLGRSLAQLPRSVACPGWDRNFGFSRWLEVERSLAARSAFYVAVERNSDRQGHPNDVAYDVRSKAMRQALTRVIDAGWEVGLHASINARRSPERVGQQVHLLEEILPGYRVKGCRHHYWAMDPELPERTLWHHAAAGLQYDSSFGLNDAAGYRRGMCWPFTPYDRQRRMPVPILEIPPTLMDGAIFCHNVTGEEGKRRVREHVAATFAAGGAVVLDWHVEQANPRRLGGAGPALIETLSELAADHRIYWASPGQAAAWWTDRRQRIAAMAER